MNKDNDVESHFESLSRSLENQCSFGPSLELHQNFQYHKKLSSFFSMPSESQDATNLNIEKSPIFKPKQIKPKEFLRSQQSKKYSYFDEHLQSKISASRQNIKREVQEQFKFAKYQMSNIISKMVRNRYVKQFKSNLFLNSYVLSKDQKVHLQNEKFLTSNKTQNFEQNDECKSSYILKPGSKIVTAVDCYIIFIQLLSLWFSPLLSCFENNIENQKIISLIILLSVTLEIFLSLNKAIIDKGEMIFDRKLIIRQYMQSQLLQDLIMILVWLYYYLNQSYMKFVSESIFLISIYVNMKKLTTNYFYHLEYLYLKGGVNSLVDLVTLIGLIYFYAHFMACFWHYIGNIHEHFETTWLIKYNLHDQSMWVKYDYSFYWATVTMATIGYGDITAQNSLEVLFSSLMILISSCVYAYLMNSIGIILKHFNDNKFKFRKQISLVSSYMKKNYVNQNIQYQVKNYLTQNFSNQQNENQEELNLILDTLPEYLKQKMTQEIQNILINKITLLKQNFSKQLLNSLQEKVKRQRYAPGDLIYHQNDINEKNLYFILEGNVELVEINSKFQLQSLTDNQCFGEFQFFTGFPPKMSAISKTYTEIVKINRDQMISILISFQKDRERFQMIQDSILQDQNYQVVFLKCQFCSKYNHQSIDCKMIQYKPDIEQRVKKLFFNQKQNRQQHFRKQVKYNSLISQQIVEDSIQNFQQRIIETEQFDSFYQIQDNTNKMQIQNKDYYSTLTKQPNQSSLDQIVIKNLRFQPTQLLEVNQLQKQRSLVQNDKRMNQNFVYTQEKEKKDSLSQIPYPKQTQSSKTQTLSKLEESNLDAFQIPQQFHQNIIDHLKNYKYYYPEYNSNQVIKRYHNFLLQDNFVDNKAKRKFNRYTFYFSLIQNIFYN